MSAGRSFTAALLIFVLLVAGIAAFTYSTIVPTRGLRFDFYPHWVGGRTVWSGQTPYTPDVTRQIQLGMFGQELPPEADQQNFAYPAYTSIALGPIIALPASVSVSVWMALQLVGVMLSPLIWLAILGWRPKPLVLGLLILGLTFGFHYPIDAYILGQFSGTVLLAISLGVLLLSRGYEWAGGAVLALATVPPTVGGPIALGILGLYLLRGQWRGLAAFTIALAVLVGISILRIGFWIPDWVNVVRAYADYAPPVWPPNFLPLVLRVGLVLVLLGALIFTAYKTKFSVPKIQHLVLSTQYSVLLLAALFLIPQTGYYYLVLLIPVIVDTLHQTEKLPGVGRWLIRLSCLLTVLSPWVYFSLPGHNPDTQSLILPIHVGLTWVAALALAYRINPSVKTTQTAT
ncbi:MAG: DUF2029 domain-containing protein [Anaerolineae bacterium]|nr:DUF2029 domain-containing protein [Anaerolineae bacterium]